MGDRPKTLTWENDQWDLSHQCGHEEEVFLDDQSPCSPLLEDQRRFHDYFYQLQFQVPLDFEDREIRADPLVTSKLPEGQNSTDHGTIQKLEAFNSDGKLDANSQKVQFQNV